MDEIERFSPGPFPVYIVHFKDAVGRQPGDRRREEIHAADGCFIGRQFSRKDKARDGAYQLDIYLQRLCEHVSEVQLIRVVGITWPSSLFQSQCRERAETFVSILQIWLKAQGLTLGESPIGARCRGLGWL